MKTKLLKFTKLHITKLLSIFFFILLFSSYLSTFAIGQPYNPGETLDPSCAPGDTNCTVTVGGTPSGSSGQIQFNNGGLFAGTADLAWTAGTATTHFSVGPGITFTKADYETVPNPAVDEISPSVHITRGQDRAIYNTVSESEYDNSTYLSPLGTEWNSADGWSDLSNISTRTYDTFYNALGGSIGDNIIGAELVMHDIAEDTYYKFSFSFWASNGTGGGFSYTRNLIDPLTFALGPSVTFTKTFPTDIVSTSVHLTRAGTKGLYNPLQEQFYDDNDYLSPLGTEWNSDGWNDLADVDTRTYDTFYNVLDQSVGNNIIGAELVMHDIAQNKYYKFSFSSWTQNGNGSGFSYTRNLITLGNGSENLLTTSSNLLIGGSARYLNFGTNSGNSGYGIRDTGGVLQFKHDGGAWANLGESPINLVNSSSLFSGGAMTAGTGSTATYSIFLGPNAGYATTNIMFSNFLGNYSGYNAFNAGYSNFLGPHSGYQATNASYSNFLGAMAGNEATNANRANFIGTQAGNRATNASYSNFIGDAAGYQAVDAIHSNFLGYQAGAYSNNATYSNFLGMMAGYNAINANSSNFFGGQAGRDATNASNSNFIGTSAGYSADYASYSNLIGDYAGSNADNASYSNFIGYNTGTDAVNADQSNFLGYRAGFSATNAANSIFIGNQAGYGDTVDNTGGSTSIVIGDNSHAGSFSNSIVLGPNATNTMTNQFLISPTYSNFRIRDVNYIMPDAQATGAGQVLTNNGSGVLSWATPSGGGGGSPFTTDILVNEITVGRGAGNVALNTAFGYQALNVNTTGGGNTANGYWSLSSNTTGYSNTANGHYSLSSNTTGNFNTANGMYSLKSNTTGSNNTANGVVSLNFITTGDYNTALGSNSGSCTADCDNHNTTSNNSLYLGFDTRALADGDTNEIVIGAATTGHGSNTVTLGNSYITNTILRGVVNLGTITDPVSPEIGDMWFNGTNLYFRKDGSTSQDLLASGGGGSLLGSTSASGGTETWLGTSAANMGTASTTGTVFLGIDAGKNATNAAFSNFIGAYTGRDSTSATFSNFIGYTAGFQATGANNSNFLGQNAGYGATSAYYSNFFGNNAGYNDTGANDSNFFGTNAGQNAVNASNSNFLGHSAGRSANSATFSNFFGISAGDSATSASNSNFVGQNSGFQATGASNSNFVGQNSGSFATNADHSNFLGFWAGYQASNASYSNLLGFQTGMVFTGNNIGSNNIIIGKNISLPNATANAINLGGVLFGTGTYSSASGNPSITPVAGGKIGIGVVTPAYTLDVSTGGVAGVVAQFTNSTGYCRIDPTSTALTCSSDISLKKNITNLGDNSPFTLTSNLDMTGKSITERLTSLIPVTYNWNTELDTDTKHAGFIAQQVQQVFPELVSADPSTNLLSLNTIGMIPYMIDAIKEMDLKVKELSLSNSNTNTLASLINSLAEQIINIKEATVKLFHIDGNVCVDDICVTKDQFKTILINNGGVSILCKDVSATNFDKPLPCTYPAPVVQTPEANSSSVDSSTPVSTEPTLQNTNTETTTTDTTTTNTNTETTTNPSTTDSSNTNTENNTTTQPDSDTSSNGEQASL